jgi:hypothetical protein
MMKPCSETRRARHVGHAAALLVLSSVLPFSASVSRGGEAEMERVRSEYPAACRRIAQFYQQMSGTCLQSTRKNNLTSKPSEIPFAVQGTNRKITFVQKGLPRTSKEGVEIVYFVGEKGSFCLRRDLGAVDKGYTIQSAGGGKNEQTAYVMSFGRYFEMAYGFNDALLSDLIDTPKRRLTSAEPISFEGRPCLELRFDAVPLGSDFSFRVVVDPEMGWMVHRREVFVEGRRFKETYRIELGPTHDGFPVPRVITCEDQTGKIVHNEFKAISFDPIPSEEFTMPHYGLPAVDARPSRGFSTLWLFAIGVVGLASAFALRWVASTLGRRRAA